jgi:hypothetical protein
MNPQITPATVAAGLNAAAATHAARTAASTAANSAAGPAGVIAEAMAALSGLDSAPTRTHVGAFERVHLALTDALAAIDGV